MTYTITSLQGGKTLHWNGTGWSDRISRTYRYPEARQTLDNMEAGGVYGATMRPIKTQRK